MGCIGFDTIPDEQDSANAGLRRLVASIRDAKAKARITGYRVYFTRTGKVVYILLCGGDKSTQAKDIRRAKLLAKEL